MREIKFRCWNAFASTMEPWSKLVSLNKIHLLNEQVDSYRIMQFTGLTGKGGVEIYEGDILGGSPSFDGLSVHWCRHCHQFQLWRNHHGCLACSGDAHWHELVESQDELEVAGNIHQNPELMEHS